MVNNPSPRSRGRPRKPLAEKPHQLAIRVTDGDREALRALAEERGLSLSAYIAEVLKRHLEDGR